MKKIVIIFLCLILLFPLYSQKFTVAVIPDSQCYANYYYQTRLWPKFPKHNMENVFYRQMEFIKDNSVQNGGEIVFAIHLGDIVEHRNILMEEWLIADKGMSIIDGIVPFGIVPGNHDYDREFNAANKDYNHIKRGLFFNDFFGPESKYFKDKEWYLDSFDDGMNSCSYFEVDDKKYIFLGLEIEPSDETIDWAQKLLDDNKNIPVILATHTFIKLDGNFNTANYRRESFGNLPKDVWDKLIKRNDQIICVLCGHVSGEGKDEAIRSEKNQYGNIVYFLLSDYQSRSEWFDRNNEKGNKGYLGDGWLRLMEFDVANNIINVKTYSTEFNEYETDRDSDFTLAIDFKNRFGY